MLGNVRRLAAAIFCALLAGCAGMPVSGPLADAVVDNGDASNPAHVDYAIIDVTPQVCRILAGQPAHQMRDIFGADIPAPLSVIGIGDELTVTIWEAGNGGLFSSQATADLVPAPRGVTLPPLVVGQDGKVTIPFAGRVPVAGKTPADVEHSVRTSLAGKADHPQVVVTVTKSVNNTVSVGGEVAKAARVPLGTGGVRMLDAIADAGGVRIPVNESFVRLTRDDKTAGISYSELLQHLDEDVYLRPGDVLTVEHAPKTFTTFGALGRNYQIPFEADSVSVEEAIAKAGGLLDQRANPAGVFIFRYEPKALVDQLAPGTHAPSLPDGIPVVFHIDLSQAGGYFLARNFAVRDKDIVYAANAQLNEVQKFLNMLGSALAPASTAAAASVAIH
jgi:polysaccharide export outer membrane protein